MLIAGDEDDVLRHSNSVYSLGRGTYQILFDKPFECH